MSSTSVDSVKGRLVQVGEQLQIPSDTLQITLVRLDQLSNEPDVDEEYLDDTAAAALALSAREDGLPLTESDIEGAWSQTLEAQGKTISISQQQLDAVGSYIDIDEVPTHPNTLVQRFADSVGMPDELASAALHILHDAYEADPTVVAGGPSPSATAGAVMWLAAVVNGQDDNYAQDTLGRVTGTSEVTVRNRSQELRNLLGEDQLRSDAYQVSVAASEADSGSNSSNGSSADKSSQSGTDTEPSAGDTGNEAASTDTSQSTAADGAGASSTSASGTEDDDGTVAEAIEDEIDDLVDTLDIGASTRLLARGMVSDAADEVDADDAPEVAATMLVAGSRIEGGDIDAVEITEHTSFEPRAVSQWLDTLSAAVDVDIPRRDADDIVADVVDQLGLSDAVHEESKRTLDRYEPEEVAADYTAAELGAGAVLFAATTGGSDVDIERVSAVSGAAPEYLANAMDSIVVSLCLDMVRGDIDYAECNWTDALLDSTLTSIIDDDYTNRVLAIAQTYVAGREGRAVGDGTLGSILADQ